MSSYIHCILIDINFYLELKLGYFCRLWKNFKKLFVKHCYIFFFQKLQLGALNSYNNFVFLVFSSAFQYFVNVMVDMSPDERKCFLQFATGCSSLPPGGLANLQPRLTIVRKIGSSDAGATAHGVDSSFPSVNTCVHYLKLPDYSTQQIMRERLLAATCEKGFHLN